MSKLSYEEKIEIYNKRKEGKTLKTLQSKIKNIQGSLKKMQ